MVSSGMRWSNKKERCSVSVVECDYCNKKQCDGECINLTAKELCDVMGFSMEDIKDIKEGEEGR